MLSMLSFYICSLEKVILQISEKEKGILCMLKYGLSNSEKK